MAGGGRRVRGAAATELFRRVAPRTYWCPSCSAPSLTPRCPRCGGEAVLVRATQPADVRPAFELDVAEVRGALERCYGSRVASRLMPQGRMVLLNKIQHFEAADEVFVSGLQVAVRYFDPFRGRWMARLGVYGAEIVLEEGLPGRAVSRRPLARGRVLDRSDLVEFVEPEGEAEWIAVEDSRGARGVAKFTSSGSLRVTIVWRARGVPDWWPGKPSGLDWAVRVNEDALARLEGEAVEFLRREAPKFKGRRVVMLSGGKDSTVAAALAVESGVTSEAIFLDTGLEHDDTLRTVEEVEAKLGLTLHRLEAGDAFWRHLGRLGPPARDYRWCTRIVKLAVMARGLRHLGVEEMVSITGQRAVESTSRALAGRVAPTGPPNPRGVMLSPIYSWSSLAEHLYIRWRGLPLNPLYRCGFERVGCFMCPTSRIPELRVAAERSPGKWARWESYLRRYARSRRLPGVWLELHLWRWAVSYPGDLAIQLRRRGYEPRELLARAHGAVISFDPVTGEYLLLETPRADLGRAAGFAHALGYRVRLGRGVLEAWKPDRRSGELRFTLDERPAVKPIRGGKAALIDGVTVAYVSSSCLGGDCALCTYVCKYDAVRLEGGAARVDEGRCVGWECRECIKICPLTLRANVAVKLAP